jgi:hypothetical protein
VTTQLDVSTHAPDIARRRLANQHLSSPTFRKPNDVVTYLGAVQAQDYAGAKWAIAQRTRGALDAAVEQALTAGTILRTHVLRPTWHFVAPADIRWMLALTAPRVNALMAYYDRKLELDDDVFRRSNRALTKALRDGTQLTRPELAQVLLRAGVDASLPQRLGHLMMRAELDAVVCSGARRGKQFTYALLEERVPPAAPFGRDESLHELTMRYFTTRGPATPQDFSWWSGLTVADAKKGLHLAEDQLESETIGNHTYWFDPAGKPRSQAASMAHLLPNYDEFFIAYKDRSAIGHALRTHDRDTVRQALSAHVIAVDGQLVGGWKRTITKDAVVIELNVLTRLTDAHQRLIVAAATRFGAFLELPVVVQ